MMTYNQILHVLGMITYKDNWSFVLGRDAKCSDRPYLQVHVVNTADSVTGEATWWRGAKVYLSTHMCRQEVIGCAYKAVREAEEHEMREWFRYRGRSIFNPHLDPDKLVDLITEYGKDAFVMRENAMSMEEV